jgi:hypothetical protein
MGPSGWLHGGGSGDVASGSHKSDSSRLSYEELCRAHIEKLIAAAAAQQVQSDLQVGCQGQGGDVLSLDYTHLCQEG